MICLMAANVSNSVGATVVGALGSEVGVLVEGAAEVGELVGELLGEEVGAGVGAMEQNLAYSASSVVHWASSSAVVVGAADGTLVGRAADGEAFPTTMHASTAITAAHLPHRGLNRSGKMRRPPIPSTHLQRETKPRVGEIG